jgi:hypothetical protein
MMPRFSLKDLLIGTALLSAGVVSIVGIWRLPTDISLEAWGEAIAWLWYGGGALIGAALFTPFKRPWSGVLVGLVVQLGILIAIFGIAAIGKFQLFIILVAIVAFSRWLAVGHSGVSELDT